MNLRLATEQLRPANDGVKSVRSPQAIESSRGFTLIEMILVMALLVVAVSFVTPHLAGFFRGRTLKSEASQLMSLMHEGQSRAVSSGVPMVLWFDTKEKKYGLEEEPGYVDKDPKAVEFTLNENLDFEIADDNSAAATTPGAVDRDPARDGLPQISFLPDGTIEETSPQTIKILDRDANATLSLTQTRDRNDYEIATNSVE